MRHTERAGLAAERRVYIALSVIVSIRTFTRRVERMNFCACLPEGARAYGCKQARARNVRERLRESGSAAQRSEAERGAAQRSGAKRSAALKNFFRWVFEL